MPNLPAFCDSCGTIFPSGIVVENSNNITINNVESGPCPNCKSTGHIPDGIYNVIGKTIEILNAPNNSSNQIMKLKSILENARKNKLNYDEITKKIIEETPELQSFKDILPQKRSELYQFITIIILIITFFINYVFSHKENIPQSNVTNITVTQIINYIYENNTVNNGNDILKVNEYPCMNNEKTENKLSETVYSKVGRNEKCPCRSGKKYKHCHGK